MTPVDRTGETEKDWALGPPILVVVHGPCCEKPEMSFDVLKS